MLFCEKCGSILVPKKDGRKTNLSCSCGFTAGKKENIVYIDYE